MTDDVTPEERERRKARIAETERRYLDSEPLDEFDQRYLAYTMYAEVCHACAARKPYVLGTLMPRCVDCIAGGITTNRPSPHGGPRSPRCATHYRARKAAQKAARQAAHVERTYGITEEEYQALYEYQGGVCNICRRAKGKGARRLAVDHDHTTGEVRQLCCLNCNLYVLGHLRDDVEALQRAADSINDPPARKVIGVRYVPMER